MADKILTPPVINRAPLGLLDFFGIKSGGRNPQNIAATVAPTLDLWNLYEQDALEVYGDGTGVAAGGALGGWDYGGPGFLPGIVPENEFWHIREYSATVAAAAGITAVALWPMMQVRVTNGVGAGGRTEFPVGATVQYQGAALGASRWKLEASDFWLPPGGILGGYTGALEPLATAMTAFQSVRLVRYRRS